jgi:hypothetical protein
MGAAVFAEIFAGGSVGTSVAHGALIKKCGER